jgi:hypothetical protein
MWMAHARYRADGVESTSPLLIELARPSPGRFATLFNDLADSALSPLRRFYTRLKGTNQTATLRGFLCNPVAHEKSGTTRRPVRRAQCRFISNATTTSKRVATWVAGRALTALAPFQVHDIKQ